MDRYDAARRRQSRPSRSALGYWVPLAVTVTLATAGLAAWIWSERQQDNDHDDGNEQLDKDNAYSSDDQASQRAPPGSFDPPPPSYPASESRGGESHQGFLARMTGRTPSPQQFLDTAGRRISAGVAAAGAAVGLSGITRSEDREPAFSDHERWNEEAESKRTRVASLRPASVKSRRTVAIIVSAHSSGGDNDDEAADFRTEHASILSHLPHRFDSATTRLFVLIYAPDLNTHPLTTSPNLAASSNLSSSSYAAISNPANTPSESSSGTPDPTPPSSTPSFDAVWTQALALVDRPSMILPFSTPTGYIHILRHLAPSLVYLSDSSHLSGHDGDNVAQLKGWVGQTILVVGDDGHGGLADTETEDESHSDNDNTTTKPHRWWETNSMIGLGKDIEVVDADRVGDDWQKRLGS